LNRFLEIARFIAVIEHIVKGISRNIL